MVENLQIRQKLILILIVPLLALVALTMVRFNDDLAAAREASRSTDHALLASRVTALVHELQREGDLSLGYLAGSDQARAVELTDQRDRTNRALQAYATEVRSLGVAEGNQVLSNRLVSAQGLLDQLEAERQRVDEADNARAVTTRLYYGDTVTALLDAAAARQTDDPRGLTADLAVATTGSNLIARVKGNASQERGLIYSALVGNELTEPTRALVTSLVGTQDSGTNEFLRSASRDQRRAYAAETVRENDGLLVNLRGAVLAPSVDGPVGGVTYSTPEGQQQALNILTANVDQLRQVEVRLGEEVTAISQDNQAAATRQAVIDGAVLLVTIALAVLFSLLVARSMVRQLRRLAAGAQQVAVQQLPNVVDRLQRGEIHLDEIADHGATLAQTKDEIGQVARAFDAVHQVALRVAGEQAALRHSIGELFLNLARRSQVLIDRQLDLIDELEQDEADPDELANLFRLDHLATRMRRNAENLIVLSDTKPQRRWSEPVALLDVIRASLAEVEDYQRTDVLVVDRVLVAGIAANDVVHLLAELLENATSFSSSESRVQVAGQVIGSGYLIEVEDRGIGMSDEQLNEANERLAHPSAIDPALSRTLGFHVVGRLAVRHGIAVQLRHSWYGGITALIRLPASVLAEGGDRPSLGVDAHTSRRATPLVPALNGAEMGASGLGRGGAGDGRSPYLPLRPHVLSAGPRSVLAPRAERDDASHEGAEGLEDSSAPRRSPQAEPDAWPGDGWGDSSEYAVNRQQLIDIQKGFLRRSQGDGEAPPEHPGPPTAR